MVNHGNCNRDRLDNYVEGEGKYIRNKNRNGIVYKTVVLVLTGRIIR